MKIHVAIITHKHGTNVYTARTREALAAQVADYCREWWDRDGPDEPKPDPRSPGDLVRRYFDWCGEIGSEESLETHESDVPDEPVADVDPEPKVYPYTIVEGALCVYEEMLRRERTTETDQDHRLWHEWRNAGDFEMRRAAVQIAEWAQPIWAYEDAPDDGQLLDGHQFDWEFIPALLDLIEWGKDGATWTKPDGTPAELARQIDATLAEANARGEG